MIQRRSFLRSLAGVAAIPLIPVPAAVPDEVPVPVPSSAPIALGFTATNLHTGATLTIAAGSAQEAVEIAARLNFSRGGGTWSVSSETAQVAIQERLDAEHAARANAARVARQSLIDARRRERLTSRDARRLARMSAKTGGA